MGRPPSRRWCGAVVLVTALALSGCGGGDDREASPTTDQPTTTSGATTTSEQPTTTAAPACAELAPLGEVADVGEATADVDGDGTDDQLSSYRLGAAEWHLRVVLADGGGSDLVVPTTAYATVAVLGGADLDGDRRDEVWARTGAGASALIVGLFGFGDCALHAVTFPDGSPAELPVGGSVGTAAGVECGGRADPASVLTSYTASNTGDDEYEITAVEYALEGAALVQTATSTSTASVGDEALARATSFTCGDVAL